MYSTSVMYVAFGGHVAKLVVQEVVEVSRLEVRHAWLDARNESYCAMRCT